MAPYYIFNKSTELWPDVVTAASLNAPGSGNDCLSSMNRAMVDCPAGGFRNILDWGKEVIFGDLSVGSNITVANDRGDTRRLVTVKACDGTAHGRVTAMTLTQAVTTALVAYWAFARNNFKGVALTTGQPKLVPQLSSTIYAPRVEVLCNLYSFNATTINNRTAMRFPALGVPSNSSRNSTLRAVPESAFNASRLLNATDFMWIEAGNGSSDPSINAVVTIPTVSVPFAGSTDWQQETAKLPCSIYAQWVPVNVSYQPNTQDAVTYDVLDSTETCLTSGKSPKGKVPARNMKIDKRYADSINQDILFAVGGNKSLIIGLMDGFTYNMENSTTIVGSRSILKGSGDRQNPSINEFNRNHAEIVAASLAAAITDSLARIAGNGHWPYSAPIFVKNITSKNMVAHFPVSSTTGGQFETLNNTVESLESWIQLNPKFERFGYGYKWRGSRTSQLGVSILLLHLFMALAHIAYVLYQVIVKHQGTTSSFDTIGEIVALALNSHSSAKLQNTSGGINHSKTWKEIVAVRETSAGHLELVIDPESKTDANPPRIGVTYS